MLPRVRRLLRRFVRPTVRMRLAITTGLLATLVGVVAVVGINVLMQQLPTYMFAVPRVIENSESVPVTRLTRGRTISVATPDALFRTLWLVSGSVVLVLVIASFIVSWIVAGRALAPLSDLDDAARRAARGQLRHRLAVTGPPDQLTRLAVTFNQMLGRLDQQFESHRRFAANASHELRTPLATTKAILDLAADESVPPPTPAEFRHLIDRLRTTNNRSIHLVEALLDLADSENARVDPELISLDQISQDVLIETRATAVRRQIDLSYVFNDIDCYADQQLVHMIITNLLSNAIQHNVQGGRVQLATTRQDDWAVLTVTNTGHTLTQDDLDTLADPFTRTRVGGEGHGLGLAITRNLVQANRGELNLRPAPGGGVVAEVRLPWSMPVDQPSTVDRATGSGAEAGSRSRPAGTAGEASRAPVVTAAETRARRGSAER